jgi:hypothetical protein
MLRSASDAPTEPGWHTAKSLTVQSMGRCSTHQRIAIGPIGTELQQVALLECALNASFELDAAVCGLPQPFSCAFGPDAQSA